MDPLPGIVGRQGELERLESALNAIEADRSGRIVELVGEPGIGKTRLVDELCARADDRGHLVLAGVAAEFERELPFGLILDALDSYLEAAQGREVDRLGAELTAELATIFPSLREYAEEDAPWLHSERHRAHRAVRSLLEGLAAGKPLVLALDDVHWADDSSLEIIATLMRRPPAGPVLVALAFRAAQEPEMLVGTARIGGQRGWLDRIELGPLPQDAAGELLSDGLDAAIATELVRESGGNPFYLTELARLGDDPLGGDGSGTAATLDGGDVPAAVREALEQELRDLGAEARMFVQAAAVSGEPFEPDLAAEIAGIPEGEALDILDRVLASALVRPTEMPRRFRFRHPLVRRAVYESAPRGWVLSAHGRAAEALARRGVGTAERAVHVEHSASTGDAEAIDLLAQAANEASARAPASAARWLEAAVRLLPDHGPPSDRRVELLGSLAGALAATGRLQEAADAIAELLEILPEDAILPRVRLVAAAASLKHLLGRHAEAREGLLRHADVVEAGSPEGANLQIELAVDAFYAMEFERMKEWAAEALSSAGRLADPMLTAVAEASLAYADTLLGNVSEAEAHRAAATAIVDAAADEELVARLDAVAHLGWTDYHLGHYPASLRHLERGLAISRGSGQVAILTHFRQGRAVNLAACGRLADAIEQSEETVEAARLSSNRQALSYSLAWVSWWGALAGRLDEARAAGQESLELAREIDANILRVVAGAGVSEMHIQAGDYDRASELLRATCGGDGLPLVPRGWRPLYFEMLTRAEASAERPERAAAAAAEAEAVAEQLGIEFARGHGLRAKAAALLAGDDAAAAAQAAASAAAADDAAGAVVNGGRSRLLAGQAQVAAGNRERGVTELREAERILGACGAERLRGLATRELRRLGKRTRTPRSAAATGPAGLPALTGREREIAELVTARKTNRQIAEELVLSEKTIESHLRNVFFKLGVSSRVEVAQAVEREPSA